MQLRARLHPTGDDSRAILERSPAIKGAEATSDRYPVAVTGGNLSAILQGGDGAGGFWVSAEAAFSKSELGAVTHFEVVCRKFIPESARDTEHNADLIARAPRIAAGGEHPIILPHGFALSRIPLKPNGVGAIGDWTAEYVIGSAVARVFEQAGLTGWSVKPVLNLSTQSPQPGFAHLFSDTLMAPAGIDCSVERIQSAFPEEDGALRHLGCLSYPASALESTPDFSRTAEPWGGWHGLCSWIVSARVVKACTESKLRGWAFRPVLIAESDLYRQYLGQWRLLCQAVSESGLSQFDGGRW
jgi:hypothetical protein